MKYAKSNCAYFFNEKIRNFNLYTDICEKIHLCNNKNIINNIFPPLFISKINYLDHLKF